jgi:hypothetical protein
MSTVIGISLKKLSKLLSHFVVNGLIPAYRSRSMLSALAPRSHINFHPLTMIVGLSFGGAHAWAWMNFIEAMEEL